MRDQIEALELSTQNPLAAAAFNRLYQVTDDPVAPNDRDRILAYASKEAKELERQAAYYERMSEFYHPNLALSRAAEAAVMRELLTKA